MSKNLPNILNSKLLVVKIGSSILIENNCVNIEKLNELLTDIQTLKKLNINIVLVVSGSVALGKEYLKISPQKKNSVPEKQALASCGQSLLMKNFIDSFNKYKLKVAQILLTSNDTEHRESSINARDTITILLNSNVVPIINENDTVSNEEIKFGDNDRLAARVAQILNADQLILLSDVDGLYDKNPKLFKNAKLIKIVENIDDRLIENLSNETNELGSGGMKTKVQAAKIALNSGCDTIISSGRIRRPLQKVIKTPGYKCTWFIANKLRRKNMYKNWIAGSLKIFGTLVIDEGAHQALKKGASLLPSGIISVKGKFKSGDIIEVQTKNKKIIARGIVTYSFQEVRLICGKKTSQIEKILGYIGKEEIIHRDYLTFEGPGR